MSLNVEKLSQRADSLYTKSVLALVSFTESCIFIVPPDPLLIALVFVRPHRWLRLAVFTAAWSLAGALFGYALGALFYDTIGAKIVALYHLETYMQYARDTINSGVFLFTLVMAFTPIPFKIAVLTAGMAHANIALFGLAMVIGRSTRYIVLAYIARFFGTRTNDIIKRYSLPLALLGMAALALWALLALW